MLLFKKILKTFDREYFCLKTKILGKEKENSLAM